MSAINMENLAITKLCLEEILQEKRDLEELVDLQDSVSYGLNLNIRSFKNVIEDIDERLKDYR